MGKAPPGERRIQILQAIAAMLECGSGEKITTAALAARLEITEAALYRHFASKAQMFEGLIEFIESSLFSVINQIAAREEDGLVQAEMIVLSLLRFANKNNGLTRVLTGSALVHEHPRLQARINQIMERIEATLKQSLRLAMVAGQLPAAHPVAAHADMLMCFIVGRWQRYAQGDFSKDPLADWPTLWALLRH